jgi:hypothetical protein
MAVEAHSDDRMACQGTDGVLDLRNSEGLMVVETPGRRRKVTMGAQKVSGWLAHQQGWLRST